MTTKNNITSPRDQFCFLISFFSIWVVVVILVVVAFVKCVAVEASVVPRCLLSVQKTTSTLSHSTVPHTPLYIYIYLSIHPCYRQRQILQYYKLIITVTSVTNSTFNYCENRFSNKINIIYYGENCGTKTVGGAHSRPRAVLHSP